MPALVVLLDANVLYPAELRSFLMHLAVSGLYQAKWSEDIHEEWISNLLTRRPDLTRAKLDRTRELMQVAIHDALGTGYSSLILRLLLPDPGDRHVLAAAIKSKSSLIVTNNRKDFPAASLEPLGIEAISPDLFVLRLLSATPHQVYEAAENHRLSLRNPAKTEVEYLDTLESQGLLQAVVQLRKATR
jgi:hypothetical protein